MVLFVATRRTLYLEEEVASHRKYVRPVFYKKKHPKRLSVPLLCPSRRATPPSLVLGCNVVTAIYDDRNRMLGKASTYSDIDNLVAGET